MNGWIDVLKTQQPKNKSKNHYWCSMYIKWFKGGDLIIIKNLMA